MRGLNQEKEHMISIICPFTDERMRQEMLEASLAKQTFRNYEAVFLSNHDLGMDRASDVLNYGVKKAVGDILLFAHQDVILEDERILEKIVYYCDNYEFGIGAPAGVRKSDRKVYATVIHGPEKILAGESFSEPMEADACDECFFFIKRKDFIGFEDLGATWHFYAVDYSIRCLLGDQKVFLFPLQVYHLSPGWSLDRTYWQVLKKLCQKYRGQIKAISTTIGIFDINLLLPLRIIKRKLVRKLETRTHGDSRENAN